MVGRKDWAKKGSKLGKETGERMSRIKNKKEERNFRILIHNSGNWKGMEESIKEIWENKREKIIILY